MTGGGFGGVLSEESKEKQSKAIKDALARPEIKEKLSKALKEFHSRPEVKEKQSKASKEVHSRLEVKEKQRKSIKDALARPEVKEKQRKAIKDAMARPEIKEKLRKSLKDAMARPEVKEKLSKSLKETLARPEYKEKQSKASRETFANKEMIFLLTGEKKIVHTNDMLLHLKAGWTFTQSYIGIYNEKLHIQKTIPFRKIKNKDALYKKLIGYLENGYEIGCLSILKEETIQPAVLLGEYCTKRKMYALF